MNFDNLIYCTRCGSDAAYVQEVNTEIKIEMCLGCGFQSNSLMKQGSEFLKEQMEVLPEIYKALIDEEEDTGKIWMPSTTRVEGKGMIFAEGNSRDNWRWAAAKDVEVKDEEKEKYKGAKYRTDMSTVEYFREREYIDALSYIGILPE
jgi:ribosomal protein L37E